MEQLITKMDKEVNQNSMGMHQGLFSPKRPSLVGISFSTVGSQGRAVFVGNVRMRFRPRGPMPVTETQGRKAAFHINSSKRWETFFSFKERIWGFF